MVKKALGLFLLALIVIHTTYSDTEFLDSIKDSEFGKTILQTIQIELKAEKGDGGMKQIFIILDKLRNSLKEEQSSDDTDHKAKLKKLNGEIKSLTEEIDTLNADLSNNKDSLRAKSNKLKQVEAKLAKSQGALDQAKENIDVLEKQRTKEHNAYLKKSAKLYDLIAALQEAKTILSPLREKKRFVLAELPNILSQITSRLDRLRFSDGKYSSIVSNLADLMKPEANSNEAILNKIVDIIDEIIDGLNDDITDCATKERKAKNRHDVSIRNLRSAVALHESNVFAEKREQGTLATEISSLRDSITNAETVLESKQTKLDDYRDELSAETTGYKSRSDRRTDQLEILDKVENILRNSLPKAKEYLKKAVF